MKFGPTTPFVGVGLSENFDLGCVEKLRCSRGLGSPFCLLTDGVSVDTGDEYEPNDTCEGGDLGLKCGLRIKINRLKLDKYVPHVYKYCLRADHPQGRGLEESLEKEGEVECSGNSY